MQSNVIRNKSGHAIYRLHYTDDPDKNPSTEKGKKWVNLAESLYPGGKNSLGWRREMEIDPYAGAGELVISEFIEREDETIVDPYEIPESSTLFGGLDWGSHNPISFHVYEFTRDNVCTSIWEWYDVGKSPSAVCQAIRMCPYYDRLQWIAADPTMWTENQHTNRGLTSIARMFYEDVPDDLKVDKLIAAHYRSDQLFIQKMKERLNATPIRFRVSKVCSVQIRELRNIRYQEASELKNSSEKIVDKDNHSWDDAKYCLLTHPSAQVHEKKQKLGTFGYLNEMSEQAAEIAEQTGQDVQTVFNDIYESVD